MLTDRAYDADSLHDIILEQDGEPATTPPQVPAPLRMAYKEHWGIKGFFVKLKQWRRVATRYDKLVANFLGFVKIASIMLLLK